MNLLLDHAEQFYESLSHQGDFSDLRCIDVEQSKYINRSILKGWAAIREWLQTYNGRGNCFIGRNPRNEDGTVKDVRTYSFDIDYGPRGAKRTGATLEQVNECFKASQTIADSWPWLNVGFSGNGILLWGRCGGGFPSLASLEDVARSKVAAWNVDVDKTHDAARMVKFLGSVSCKGARRMSRIVRLSYIRGIGNLGEGEAVGSVSQGIMDHNRKQVSSDIAKIPHGRMHSELVAFAGSLRRRGLSEESIYKGLKAFAEERCEPPIDLSRLKQYARSMLNYEPETNEHGNKEVAPGFNTVSISKDFSRYEKALSARSHLPPVPTGFSLLDSFTHGLVTGGIYTVGAYPGSGKSTWCVNVAHNLCKQGKSVLYLSTELSYDRILDKFVALELNLPLSKFQKGLSHEEAQKLKEVYASQISSYKFAINDAVAPRIENVRASVVSSRPDVVIFDHIQQVGEGSQKRNETISVFLNELIQLSREFNFAVLIASQFTRPSKYIDYASQSVKTVKSPTLFDFKECAGIENKSRVAVLIYEKGEAVGLDQPVMIFEVAKCSFGKKGKVELIFDMNLGKFIERDLYAIHSEGVSGAA